MYTRQVRFLSSRVCWRSGCLAAMGAAAALWLMSSGGIPAETDRLPPVQAAGTGAAAPSTASSAAVPPAADKQLPRLREGTELAPQAGTFRAVGERWLFVGDDGGRRFACLENLNLERVVRTLEENPRATRWTVSATVTEFRGSNYLLITRAVQAPGSAG